LLRPWLLRPLGFGLGLLVLYRLIFCVPRTVGAYARPLELNLNLGVVVAMGCEFGPAVRLISSEKKGARIYSEKKKEKKEKEN
jgi:hypothetical protein